jgi:UPF0755 protein
MPEAVQTRVERNDRSGRKGGGRRRSLLILLSFFLVLLIVALAAGNWYRTQTSGVGPKTPVTVVVPEGVTGAQVANLLETNGVIHSTFLFRLALRLRNQSSGFEAGEYHLTTNMAFSQLISTLQQGPVVHAVSVTIPEGLTVPQTAERLAPSLAGVRRGSFVRAATSGTYSLPPYLPPGKPTVEGFLFPNTYDFLKSTTDDTAIKRLLAEFQSEAKDLPWQNAQKMHLSDYQVVIVASMIEREAKFAADRPKVARVIYNRLARGMRLQVDATVLYALGRTTTTITDQDLQVKSPYNTYLHAGLPPTPIASPGLASLRAALDPAPGNWLYYLTVDAAGHERFTASYAQFLAWKSQFLG